MGLVGPHAACVGLPGWRTSGWRRTDAWNESIELAGKRATLAETGAWTELLRLYVRDMLAREVDARGGGTHTLQQSTTLKADTMRASDKMDSCNKRLYRSCRRTHAHRRTHKLPLRCAHWLLLTQTNKRVVWNKMNCVRTAEHANRC